MNPVTDSENVAVTENVPLTGLTDDEVSVTVGMVRSAVLDSVLETELPLSAASTALLAGTVTDTVPSDDGVRLNV